MRRSCLLATGLLANSLIVVTAATPALAQFAPGPNPIAAPVTAAQTLAGGTGSITVGGSVITSGGTTVTLSGTATLGNAGTIGNTGNGRAIDSTANNANLTVTNSGSIRAVSTDAFRVNAGGTSVSLTNSGTIAVSAGGQAIDWAAIATGANTLTNQAGGVISAVGEDAMRPGQNGVVTNAGTIMATPTVSAGAASGSDGIDLRTEKNVTVTNSGLISGRAGIATDGANVGPSSLTVTNSGAIQGVNGSGLNIDANTASAASARSVVADVTNLAGGVIKGGVLAGTAAADGDGIDVDGILTLRNSGDVLGLGAKGGDSNAEAVSIGGGRIVNNAGGRIIGSTLAADAPNGDTTRSGNGILADDSNNGAAFVATSISNAGLIEGRSGFAVKLVGSFANTVDNAAGGSITGAGSAAVSGAAIQTGDGADTLTNAGAVTGRNGSAIDLQGGDDRLRIVGGTASIAGNVSGGGGANTVTIDPGAGNSFAYDGRLSNFARLETVSGTTRLTGVSDYAGATRLTGGTLLLEGADRLSALSALELNGGTLAFAGIGAANGQRFASLALLEISTIDLGFTTALTFDALGDIVGGMGLAVLRWDSLLSPAYAFRFLGDLTGDLAFRQLIGETTIGGGAPRFSFDGAYTNIAAAQVAVPEPASLGLLAIGLAGIAGWRRRTARAIG